MEDDCEHRVLRLDYYFLDDANSGVLLATAAWSDGDGNDNHQDGIFTHELLVCLGYSHAQAAVDSKNLLEDVVDVFFSDNFDVESIDLSLGVDKLL